MNKPLVSLKVVNKNGEKVQTLVTRKIKRIYSFLKAGKNRDYMFRLSIKYGNGFKNEGDYENMQDLIWALRAFTESD